MAARSGAEKKPDPDVKPGRPLTVAVIVTDPTSGRVTVYDAGDIPIPEHAELIGDHAYRQG